MIRVVLKLNLFESTLSPFVSTKLFHIFVVFILVICQSFTIPFVKIFIFDINIFDYEFFKFLWNWLRLCSELIFMDGDEPFVLSFSMLESRYSLREFKI